MIFGIQPKTSQTPILTCLSFYFLKLDLIFNLGKLNISNFEYIDHLLKNDI